MALGQHPASQPTIHPFFIHWRKGPKIRPNVQFIISTLIMLIVLLILITIHILWNTFYEFQWVVWVFVVWSWVFAGDIEKFPKYQFVISTCTLSNATNILWYS